MFVFSINNELRPNPVASSVSSTSSSSISVVSVPFEVTGEGPTISLLGLIRCAELGLVKEFGRRAWESGPDEEAIYWDVSAGDSRPEESAISAYEGYIDLMLPVDVLRGASRAIAATSDPMRRSEPRCRSR